MDEVQEMRNKQLQRPSIQGKKPKLIQFDSEEQIQMSNNSSEQNDICNPRIPSMISQTQKTKIQRRNKVKQYLNERRSLGLTSHNRIIDNRDEDEDFDGALLNELGCIQDIERNNGEIEQFILAFNKKPENAINDYIKKQIIKSDSPQQIAKYLIKVEGLDKQLLGQYFGKNNPQMLKVLHSYCGLLNFQNVQFDKAIRQLLGRFRLPGQAQQIERIIWQFSLAYYQANKNQHKNADQLFPLAYAIIMLATDAHNPKQEKKMAKEEFIRNTQGPCPSISAQYLGGIYDRITKQKFETEVSYIQTLYARLRGISTATDFNTNLQITKQLMKGDVFLKICRSTKKFVQRKIYLSQDEQRIQWISDPPKSQNETPRFILIQDIIDLTLGLGSQVMKKNKVPQEFDSLCFTITTTNRTLDLKAKTNKQRAKWVNYVRATLILRRQNRIQQLQKQYKLKVNKQQIQQIWNTEVFPKWDDHWDYKQKKPKVKNIIVRGFESICGCMSAGSNKNQKNDRQSELQEQGSNKKGFHIKSSLLETLWRMGLPANSRKILWPLVIGNNLALTQTIIEEIRKRIKMNDQLTKFTIFNEEVLEMAEICRQFRPDIPPIRDILLVSEVFWKVIPKTQTTNPINALLNELHLNHFLSFYRADKNQIDTRIRLFQHLLQVNAPKVKDHFEGLKLQIRLFLVSWFLSIFYDCFRENEEFLLRIWDNFLLQGQLYLFKVGIAMIKYYEIELKMCTFHEALKILRFPKNTSFVLFFKILEQNINVKQEDYIEYVQKRKNAVIKTKVQAIPLQ